MKQIDWISVEDSLPDCPDDCYGWSAKDYFVCCKYSYDIGRMYNGEWINMTNDSIEVTHWMPLPEPPSPRKSNETD